MILVTTGTNEQPFDRLVAAGAALAGEEPLLMQYGSSRVAHGDGTWIEFMPFDELAQLMCDARVVICHAGVGSVMLARRCGKTPIVMPRRLHLGEAVDDHQVELARRLQAAGMVRLAEDEADLAAAVRSADAPMLSPVGADLPGAAALAADVRGTLESLLGVPPGGGPWSAADGNLDLRLASAPDPSNTFA